MTRKSEEGNASLRGHDCSSIRTPQRALRTAAPVERVEDVHAAVVGGDGEDVAVVRPNRSTSSASSTLDNPPETRQDRHVRRKYSIRVLVAFVWMLAHLACARGGFTVDYGTSKPSPDGGDLAGETTDNVTTGDGSPFGDPLGQPLCDASDPTLIACFTFEGESSPGEIYNDSTTMNHAIATNVSFEPGRTGLAVRTTVPATVVMPTHAAFGLDAMTLEAWVRPDSLPTSADRVGIIDGEGQWAIFLYPGGEVRCSTGYDGIVTAVAAVTAGVWSHLSCATDGSRLSLFVDGALAQSICPTTTISGIAPSATAIGSNIPNGGEFDGLVDDVRIWTVARPSLAPCP